MKELNYKFGRPEGLWNAALPQSEELKHSVKTFSSKAVKRTPKKTNYCKR